MTLGDFGEHSAHRATVMTHEQFMQSGAEGSRCLPMFQRTFGECCVSSASNL